MLSLPRPLDEEGYLLGRINTAMCDSKLEKTSTVTKQRWATRRFDQSLLVFFFFFLWLDLTVISSCSSSTTRAVLAWTCAACAGACPSSPPAAAVTTAPIIFRTEPSTSTRSRSLSAPKKISLRNRRRTSEESSSWTFSSPIDSLSIKRSNPFEARAQLLYTNKTSRALKIIIDTLVSQSLIRSDRLVAEIKEEVADTWRPTTERRRAHQPLRLRLATSWSPLSSVGSRRCKWFK